MHTVKYIWSFAKNNYFADWLIKLSEEAKNNYFV